MSWARDVDAIITSTSLDRRLDRFRSWGSTGWLMHLDKPVLLFPAPSMGDCLREEDAQEPGSKDDDGRGGP